MILKEDNSTKKYRIINIDSILDIQWWLYKSILSRQPLDSKYYKEWYKLYKEFYILIEKIETDSIPDFVAVKEFEKILYSIKNTKRTLKNVLNVELESHLSTIIEKIISGINNIISILEEI